MNKIRYSQCWEDPLILEQYFKITKEDIILSISSGGDNSLFLLSFDPKQVISIDNNPSQNYLLELKSLIIGFFEWKEVLEFFGILEDSLRLEKYKIIRKNLTKNAREFWDNNLIKIKKGIIHCGRFEKYINLFRRIVLPLILSKKQIKEFLNLSFDKQEKFYKKNLKKLRWKIIFKMFFSERIMKLVGRDKDYFKYNNKKASNILFKRVERGLTKKPIKDNYFLEYILTGNYPINNLPEYLKKDNFLRIKINLNKLKIVTNDLYSFLKEQNPKINMFNLSDIFEVMSEKQANKLIYLIEKYSTKKSKLVFWENLVDRNSLDFNKLRKDKKSSKVLFRKDRVFFYGNLNCFSSI